MRKKQIKSHRNEMDVHINVSQEELHMLEVKQIKSQQTEILNLLLQQNKLISRTPTTTTASPSKKQRTIYVYNTVSTPNFSNFEKYLQNKITDTKKRTWLRSSNNNVPVKKLKQLDDIPSDAGLILLCCFSAAATMEPSSIVPPYVYLRSKGYLVICVCFRPDTTHTPVKLFENSSMQEVPTYSMHVNKKGVIDTHLTSTSIKAIGALFNHAD